MKIIENAVSDDDAMDITANLPAIITPSLPERAELMVEACESVKQQTVACAHHVYLDHARIGPALIRNTIMERVSCEYVGFLDDDDLLDPEHVELLLAALDADQNGEPADLAFSWYRSEGAPETPRVTEWDDWAYGTMLGGRNLIPVTVMARRHAILNAGGFRPDDRYEDYKLWMRMLANGCRFTVVPLETWTYRMHGDNRTHL